MLFVVEPSDGEVWVTLPQTHPLAEAGRYPSLALLELAAQLAGRVAPAAPGHRGMLVELESVDLLVESVAAGTRIRADVSLVRSFGPLHRFEVRLVGVLSASLTLRITA